MDSVYCRLEAVLSATCVYVILQYHIYLVYLYSLHGGNGFAFLYGIENLIFARYMVGWEPNVTGFHNFHGI